MKLPIVAYGDPVLRKKAAPIDRDYPGLAVLIENIFETMYNAHGVGLAAPQIGLSIRLFVIDASPFADEDEKLDGFKKAFLNPQIVEESGQLWDFNEGCLSIPDIREDVTRQEKVTLTWMDENWVSRTQTFDGLAARVIQHEYDHIEGRLFTDTLSPLRRTMLRGRLEAIARGQIKVDYKMRFPAQKKGR